VGKDHLLQQVKGGHVEANLGRIRVWWHGLGHQATDLVIPGKLYLKVSGLDQCCACKCQ